MSIPTTQICPRCGDPDENFCCVDNDGHIKNACLYRQITNKEKEIAAARARADALENALKDMLPALVYWDGYYERMNPFTRPTIAAIIDSLHNQARKALAGEGKQ